MPKSIQNALEKQDSIVQAAMQLFLKQGYGATNMDRVAEEAGVTKQTVYRYFPSKGELFTAAMEKIRDNEPERYQFGSAPPEEELTRFGRDLLAFHLSPAALGVYKIILREGSEEENLLKPFMQTGPDRVSQLLIQFLQAHYPKLDDTVFYAQMFVSMVLVPRNQLIIQGKRRLNRREQEAHVDKVVRLFLNGLQT